MHAAKRQVPMLRSKKPAFLLSLACTILAASSDATEPASAEPAPGAAAENDKAPAGFSAILRTHTTETFRAIADYVERKADAPDVERAYQWMFETALQYGLEEQALGPAETYLAAHDRTQAEHSTLARRVQSIGLAKTGKTQKALAAFDNHLETVSIRSPNASVDLGFALIGEAQLADDFEAIPQILDRLSSKFFLNAEVRRLIVNRSARLALAEQAAPRITVTDLEGAPVDLKDYEGRVLLIDFWATFCPPCLEAFPALKQLYSEHHENGLEVLGISLDEDPAAVKEFREKWKLPWRLAVSRTDTDDTRRRYRAETIPAVFVVDRDGEVAYVDLRGDQLRRAVEKLIATAP